MIGKKRAGNTGFAIIIQRTGINDVGVGYGTWRKNT